MVYKSVHASKHVHSTVSDRLLHNTHTPIEHSCLYEHVQLQSFTYYNHKRNHMKAVWLIFTSFPVPWCINRKTYMQSSVRLKERRQNCGKYTGCMGRRSTKQNIHHMYIPVVRSLVHEFSLNQEKY